jgi:hypothetical protein
MSIWKQFISTLTVFVLVFGVAVTVIFHRPGQGLEPREIKLVFEGVILIVFVVMTALHALLWKKNATEDYFQSRGEAAPPEAEPQYRHDLKRPGQNASGRSVSEIPAGGTTDSTPTDHD